MDETRLKGLMGLCVRAGQGVFGEDSCLKAVRAGQAGALLTDEGISAGAAEKYSRACERAGIPLIRIREGFLEEATGKPGKAMAVRKGSFADQIIRCLESFRADQE